MDQASRLHIAWVADTWDGSAGGVTTGRRFVTALRERHEVTVVAAQRGAPGDLELRQFRVPLAARLMRENGFVFAVPRRRLLDVLFRRVDVVHVQFPFWLGLRAVAIARAAGAPLVTAFHVQPENILHNVGVHSPRLVEATYRFVLRRYFDEADAVVCPSPFALQALRSRGLIAPAVVISNGIPPGLAPRQSARDPEGRILLLVAGRLSREKRVDVAIEGVRRSRHAHRIQLVITGRGPLEREVRRQASDLPVPPQVGFVSEERLRALLRDADLLVHASEVELEGMAVLEALACGTPALLADAPASAAVQFALGPEFLFRPADPQDLSRRLDALLDRPDRLREARAECLARAEAYRFEDSVARLEDLYRGVVARRLSAPRRDAGATRSTARPAAQ